MEHSFDGRVAVITGAGGVLCSVMAKALAEAGARVALLGRTAEKVQRVADEITAVGGTARAYVCDVCDRDSVEDCHRRVVYERIYAANKDPCLFRCQGRRIQPYTVAGSSLC